MSNIRNINVRFNLDKEEHKKAWEYLQTRDPNIFPSYSQTVIAALVGHFDRYYSSSDSGMLADEQMQLLTQNVSGAVERTIERTLPAYLAGYLAGTLQTVVNTPTDAGAITAASGPIDESSEDNDSLAEDIDWGFLSDA